MESYFFDRKILIYTSLDYPNRCGGAILVSNATEKAKKLLDESLKELESSKGSVLTGIQKLSRAASILNDEEVSIWCEIQFGKEKYTYPLEEYYKSLFDFGKELQNNGETKELKNLMEQKKEELKKINLKEGIHFGTGEIFKLGLMMRVENF